MAKAWSKDFYNSALWQQTRLAYMAYQHGLCERCSKAGIIVHHRRALRPQDMGDASRTLCWDNLELLCHHCHDLEHNARQPALRCSFDDDGNVLPPIRRPTAVAPRPHPSKNNTG